MQDVLIPLADCQSPLLVGHVRADVDSVGALAAMELSMRQIGKRPVVAINRLLVPQRLQRLYAWAGVTPVEQPDVESADLVVVMDTAATNRVNIHCGFEGLAAQPILNIDHHVTNERFGRWNYVLPDASSTCEVIYGVLRGLDWPIDEMAATMLYAGIHGDTGGFSLPNTTLSSLEVASKLAGSGARVSVVCQYLLRSQTPGEFNLLRLIYDNTRVSSDGRVAWSTADHDEIAASGCDHTVIDDQVAVPRCLEGVDIAMLFTEGLPGRVRINFRGEGEVDVLTLAKEFGGGGHHNSAGTVIRDRPLDQVVDLVVGRAVQHLNERYPRS